jgi:hypothetical protein
MAVDEPTTIVKELFEAHFYGGELDPALVWELDEHRADQGSELGPLDSLATDAVRLPSIAGRMVL